MSPAKPRKLTPRQEASSEDTAPERLRALANDPKLARLVAANPSAPAELLLELSRSDDKAVRKACTGNANTPVEALLKLGSQFPEQLLENPVFGLLLLGHPGLFEELPTSTLNSLLKRDQVPVELIRWAWKHRGESTIHSLLMNPNTPADVVDEVRKSSADYIRISAQLHCSGTMPDWAARIRDDADLQKQQILHGLLVLGSSKKCQAISEALLDLGGDTLRLCSVILPPTAIREAIASDGRTPVMELTRLAIDPDSEVRRAAAGNSRTPTEMLTLLANDQDSEVRRAVAGNSQTPADVITALANDKDKWVRHAVAGNDQTPFEVLRQLAKDRNKWVRDEVAENRGNSQTSAKELARLAKDRREYTRCWVACHSQTPAELLTLLAKDHEKDVREAVAGNEQTPAKALMLLAKDSDEDVRLRVAKNRNTPKEVTSYLHESLLKKICIEGCKGSQPSPGRRFLFTLPQCPPNLLARNFRSCSWLERFAIAGNPSTPKAVLERMANEGNQLVRRAATSNIARRASAPNRQPRQNQPIT